jgi:hypothetical protein
VNSRTRNLHIFKQVVRPGPEFPDIFPDTPGNPENPGKCPDCPGLRGGFKSTEIKLAQT